MICRIYQQDKTYTPVMKYYKGDKVYLIQTGEMAVVTRADNDELIYVEAGGVEIPVFTSDISKEINEELSSDNKTENHLVTVSEQKNIPQSEELGLFICLDPIKQSGEISDFNIYIVNCFNMELQFSFQFFQGGNEEISLTKNIAPQNYLLLYSIEYDKLNEHPMFSLKVTREEDDKKWLSFEQKIRPNNLFNKEQRVPFFSDNVFAYRLLEKWTATVTVEKDFKKERLKEIEDSVLRNISANEPKKKVTSYEPVPHEIDLHIEKLLSDHSGMSNAEIIQFQLKCFRSALEKAISGGVEKFYAIHGIGKGKLKEEIFRILPEYSQVKSFRNEYHPRYGFGATEIFLK